MTVLHICCNLAGSTVFPQLFEALAAQGLEQVVFVPEKRAADLGKNEPRGVKTIRAMTVRQSDALFFFRKAQRSVPAIEGQIDMAGVTLIHAHTLFTDGSIAARLAKKHGLPYAVTLRYSDIEAIWKYEPHLRPMARRILGGAARVVCLGGAAKEKVLELAKLLVPWCGRLTVQVVPFTEIQEEIRRNCPEEFFTLIMRRFMMRISQRVAEQVKAKALVTGESLGQVASQTMEALRVTEDVVDLPVLRPLIGLDKEEIVRLSRKIGTFDTSILPYEDCCTVFTPRHPRTKPNLEEVREAEAALDIDGLIDRAMTNREFVRIKF